MNRMLQRSIIFVLPLILFSSSIAFAADIVAAGRAKAKDSGEAVVTVKIVSAMKFSWGGNPGEEEEVKNEARGTVVSADGVTVISLAEIDPAQFWARMMGSQMGDDVTYESNLKDMKLLMTDGTEIAAEVVLRDNDLDVAVIRPKEKSDRQFAFVDLKASAEADILEPVFCIGRMGPVGQRQLRAMTSEIQGIVRKPRLYYVPDAAIYSNGTGVPVFNADSKLIGIVVMKSIPGSADTGGRGMSENMMPIVLPASDVLEIVVQAPEKAPAEEKKEEAKPAEETTEKKAEKTTE